MEKKTILVAGGGFGGVTAALVLARMLRKENLESSYAVVLVNRSPYHLYTPALYELAAIPQETIADSPLASAIHFPLQDIAAKRGVSFLCDDVIGLATENHTIRLKNKGALVYDRLVIALGSETNYFSIPGLERYSMPLKSGEDAVRLRNAVEARLKQSNTLCMVIGGAGPSGVELAAETVNFACAINEKLPEADRCAVKVVLIEATPDILPGFPDSIVRAARKRLETLGVEIKTNSAIESAAAEDIALKGGDSQSYDVLVWTGGVRGPKILESCGLGLTPKGTVIVDEFLRAKDAPAVWAVGDNAGFLDPASGKPVPWNVPAAESEAKIAARNIIASITNRPQKKFKPPARYPFVLALGRKHAIADLVFFTVRGTPGWIVKIAIELRYMLFLFPVGSAVIRWWRNVRLYGMND